MHRLRLIPLFSFLIPSVALAQVQLTGETGWRLELFAPFEAATDFTAGEIIDKKIKPEQLAKMEAVLQDRPLRSSGSHNRPISVPSGGSAPFNDDDIPW